MEVCDTCGRPRTGGTRFCTGCGTQFPDRGTNPSPVPDAAAEETIDQLPGGQDLPGQVPAGGVYAGQSAGPHYAGGNVYAGSNPGHSPADGPQEPLRPRRPLRTAALVAAAVVVVAGAVAGGWVLAGRGSQRPSPGPTPTQNLARTASPSQASPTASAFPSVSPSSPGPAPDPQPSPTATVVGTVTVASSAGQNTAASSVAALVNQYFAAINAHDYQAYVSLLTPQEQQGMTATQFANGYRSTTDSSESLVGISTAADGDTVAMVTFTSHQNPADSVNGAESCTDWQISLFLAPNGGGYLIDQPPSGYHASYAACP